MIKNIIFDLGNVLISFKPAEYFDKKEYSDSIKSKILSDIFGSKEWRMLDNGDMSTAEAIESIAQSSTLNKEEISHIFNLRTDLMFPLDKNVRILPELQKRGYKLYFLSNFPVDIYEEVKTGYYFFRYFSGGIISSEVKVSKPDSRIYKILLEKYSLIPDECMYIDDIEINVKAAGELGMKILFTAGSEDISDEVENALSF